MNKVLQYVPMITFLLVGLEPQALRAQSSRHSCAERLVSYDATSASERIGKPLWALRTCPVEGPPVVAALWLSPPAQADHLASLGNLSGMLRDARVFRALLGVVDPSGGFSLEVKTVAAKALVSLAVPCLMVSDLQHHTQADSVFTFVVLMPGPDLGIAAGNEPIGEGALSEVIAAFDRAAIGSSDQIMRARAAGLARTLRRIPEDAVRGCNWGGSRALDD